MWLNVSKIGCSELLLFELSLTVKFKLNKLTHNLKLIDVFKKTKFWFIGLTPILLNHIAAIKYNIYNCKYNYKKPKWFGGVLQRNWLNQSYFQNDCRKLINLKSKYRYQENWTGISNLLFIYCFEYHQKGLK